MKWRRLLFLIWSGCVFLTACASGPATEVPYAPGFIYVSFNPALQLILQDSPVAAPRARIPLNPPTDCTFFALRPAPHGRWVAVEWECAFGPAVELFDTAKADSHFALADPTIDSRFLAWHPDGASIYLKIGTLSTPQILRVDVESGQATELPLSAFVYDLTVPPGGNQVYYALTKGVGFGSEARLAGLNGQNPSQLLVDEKNIITLAQYSPDGSQVAFVKFPDIQDSTLPGELWVMDSSGFNQRMLAPADARNGIFPQWSSDSKKIAFVGRAAPNDPLGINLSVYDLSTSRLVTFPAAPTTQPAWSPDGARLFFGGLDANLAGDVVPQLVQGDNVYLWSLEVATGKAEKLVNAACCAGWIR